MLLGPVFMLAGLVDLAYEGFASGAGFTPLVGIGMTIFGYRRFHQGTCGIEMSDHGIFLRCYSLTPFSSGMINGHYCAGAIPWENLAEVGVVKREMTKCLGFRLRDPRDFLNSRNQLTDEQTRKHVASNKTSVGSVTRFLSDLSGRFIGYTKLPQPNDELAILEWNLKNHGYHIVCVGAPLWFFGRPYKGGPKKLVEVICERRGTSAMLKNGL